MATEKKEEKVHEKKEEKKQNTARNNLIITGIICLVIGFFLGFSVLFYKGSVNSDDIGPKVVDYVTATFLAANSASANLTSVNAKYGMYEVSFDIIQNGNVVQQDARAYVTKDGKYLMVGQVFNMTSTPVIPSATGQQQAQQQAQMQKSDKPNVKFFVMAFCPFGKQAEQGLGPAVAALEGKIVAEPHFVIYENYQGGGADYCLGDGKYCSMHGIKELNEDVRQMCVLKYHPTEWWAYVDKINSDCTVSTIDTCWKDVAKAVGFDTDKIVECQEKEALGLLKAEAELNAKYSVQGSPTVLINDAEFGGGRSPADYLSGICSAFNTAPEACSTDLGSATAAPASGGCG